MPPNYSQAPYRPSRCNYIYVCKVAADGAFLTGPEHWTVEKTGVGIYVITHGLGHTNYAFIPTVSGTNLSVPTVTAADANAVTVKLYENAVLADLPFQMLMMTMQQ
jgi:hypothetical protein